MTSKQVLLTMLVLLLGGCVPHGADPLISPYPHRVVWAVAPIRNESGSSQADGLVIADQLARQLENASNIDVLPVNRVIAVMESQQMASMKSPADVQRVLQLLGADYMVLGTIKSWDSYDPPKIGMAIELYTSQHLEQMRRLNLRRLSGASTDSNIRPPLAANTGKPVSLTSGYFDAAAPDTRAKLVRYGHGRSQEKKDRDAWRLYRINMNLYSEFVCYVMSWRLLKAERYRFDTPEPPKTPATPATQPASP